MTNAPQNEDDECELKNQGDKESLSRSLDDFSVINLVTSFLDEKQPINQAIRGKLVAIARDSKPHSEQSEDAATDTIRAELDRLKLNYADVRSDYLEIKQDLKRILEKLA